MIIKNLHFNYIKGPPVISGVDVSFSPGDIVLIDGPSGAGKSTLASLIAGHLSPQRGEIYIKGEGVTGPSRKIFVVHQENDLFPWLTVKGHLDFIKRSGIDSHPADNYDDYLEKFGLLQAAHLYPNEISGGMKRRLAILRGLMLRPDVLILDESISSLDEKLKLEIMIEIKKIIEKEGMLLILIDHNTECLDQFISKRIGI